MASRLMASDQSRERRSRPMEAERGEVTILLAKLTKGNREAASKLIPLVYAEMRRLAGAYMRRERGDHTLQPTALVNEAYLKLVEQRSVEWQSRAHFFGIAAQVMRRILVDHARGHLRDKRGGGARSWNCDFLADSPWSRQQSCWGSPPRR